MKKLIILVALAAGSMTVTAQTKYVVTDLGGVGAPATRTSAIAINNAGQVAGNSNRADFSTYRAYHTAPNATINSATDLIPPLPGGTYSAVNFNAINSLGQVAGNSNPSGRSEGFRFDTDSTIHDLGNLGGSFPSSFAWGINDLGQVTGGSNVPSTAFCFFSFGSHAFRTAANSALTAAGDLGTLISNCRSSLGTGINSSGQVTGWSDFGLFSNPEQHAMLVTGSVMQDLGILGGTATFPAASGKHAIANAINSSGQIVGDSTYNGAPNFFDEHAFLTTASGPMVDLGTLGGTDSFAFGINSSGQIVGQAGVSPVSAHGFLYAGGSMTDLNSLIAPGSPLEIITAFAINDSGQIVGTGKLGTGLTATFHPVRLDPANVAVSILEAQVISLGLPHGTQSSLLTKLQDATAAIQIGDFSTAIGDLGAFINEVNAQTGKKISASDAATLIAAANAIIAAI